jgi:hypothetical protein
MMREQLNQRLLALRSELEKGRKLAADLDEQRRQLESQLLRISGAAQVLEELLAQPEAAPAAPAPPADVPVLNPAA